MLILQIFERDVSALSQVGDKGAFQDMLHAPASLTGQQPVYSELARVAGVSMPTAKRWVSILETGGIISLLRPYSTKTSKRLTKSPAVHFMDTGFCAWLAGIKSARGHALSHRGEAFAHTVRCGFEIHAAHTAGRQGACAGHGVLPHPGTAAPWLRQPCPPHFGYLTRNRGGGRMRPIHVGPKDCWMPGIRPGFPVP